MTGTRTLLCLRDTGRAATEATLAGLSYETGLSGSGVLSGTITLDDPAVRHAVPGKSFVAVLRGGECVWAGPITGAPLSWKHRNVSVSAETDDWWLDGRIIRQAVTLSGDVFSIVRSLVGIALAAQPLPGLEVSGNLAGVETVLRIAPEDNLSVLRAIQDLAQRSDVGFEYRWDYAHDPVTDLITRTLVLGRPGVGVRQAHQAVVAGPWLVDATVPRSADGTNAALVVGAPPVPSDGMADRTYAEQVAAVRAETGDPAALPGQAPRAYRVDAANAAEYGLREQIVNLADTSNRARLAAAGDQHVARTRPLMSAWTVVFEPGGAMPYGMARVGDEIRSLLTGPVFDDLQAGWWRVERRTCKVSDEGLEELTLLLDRSLTGPGGAVRRYQPDQVLARTMIAGDRTLVAATKLASAYGHQLAALGETSVQAGRDVYDTDADGLVTVEFADPFPAGKSLSVVAVAHRTGAAGDPLVVEIAGTTPGGFTADVFTAAGTPVVSSPVELSWHAAAVGSGTPGGQPPAVTNTPDPDAPPPDPDPDPADPFGTIGAGPQFFDDRFLGYQVGTGVGLPYRLFNVGYSDNLPGNALVQEDANDGARSILGEYGHRVDLTGGPVYRGTIAVDMSPVGPYDDLPAMDPATGHPYWNYPVVVAGLCQAPGSDGLYVWNELAATTGGTFVQLPGSGVRDYTVPAGGVQYGHMRISAGKTRLMITVEDSATPGMCSLSSRIVTSAGDVLQHVGPAGETHRDVPDTLRYLQLTSNLKPWRAWRVQATNYTGPDGLPPQPA